MIKSRIFTLIETVGALVVICVWLGLLTSTVSFPNITMIGFVIHGMLVFATVTMLLTIFRSLGVSYTLLTILGALLLITGASIAYAIPNYFFWASGLQVWYWLKVSLYSVPAICIEGAIFTLFIVFYEKGMRSRTSRLQMLMPIGFVIYAAITVTMNFWAINGVITVNSHIFLSKIITAVILGVAAFIVLFKKDITIKIKLFKI